MEKNLIAWESGRQPFVCASTAESELVSYCEAHQVTESVTGLLEVANFNPDRQLYGDNRAALAAITNETGNWRTRHLRLRAFALREALADPNRRWVARHLSGTMLLADGLTKPLQGGAFENWKKLGLQPRRDLQAADATIEESNWQSYGASVALLLGSVGLWKSGNPKLAALLGAAAGLSMAMRRKRNLGGAGDSRAFRSSSRPGQVHHCGSRGDGRALDGMVHSEEEHRRSGVCDGRAWQAQCWQGGDDGDYGGEELGLENPKVRAFRLPGAGYAAGRDDDGEHSESLPRRRGSALQRGRDAMSSSMSSSTMQHGGDVVISSITEALAGLGITTNVTMNLPQSSGGVKPEVTGGKKRKKAVTSNFVDSEAQQARKKPNFEPWRLQQFLEPPKGEDRWDVSFLKDGWLIRTHGTRGRVKPFHPIHRSCPMSGGEMTGDRVTALFNIDGGEWLYDRWTDTRTWQRAGPWKGFTCLKLKTAEAASTASVGAAW